MSSVMRSGGVWLAVEVEIDQKVLQSLQLGGEGIVAGIAEVAAVLEPSEGGAGRQYRVLGRIVGGA
jgi:hypothetical protein